MRRSAYVFAPLLASAAVTLSTGCHQQPELQRCVDETNRVVDPKLCNLPPGSQQPLNGTGHSSNTVFLPHIYRYYYGGLGGYTLGSIVNGGSYTPLSGHSYSTTAGRAVSSSGTSRGGFGSSFGSSHGGGSGE
jgi:hypothetical protein